MNQLSDNLAYFLFCVVPVIAIVSLAVIARAKPEWFEKLAGEPMPKKLRRKTRGRRV